MHIQQSSHAQQTIRGTTPERGQRQILTDQHFIRRIDEQIVGEIHFRGCHWKHACKIFGEPRVEMASKPVKPLRSFSGSGMISKVCHPQAIQRNEAAINTEIGINCYPAHLLGL